MSVDTSFPNLISGPSKIVTTIEEKDLPVQEETTKTPKSFPISHLPYELRQLIYNQYLTTLPPFIITTANASIPIHTTNSLSLASPFFTSDLPASTFYQNVTFSFSHGHDMKTFSSLHIRHSNVRKIKIIYGKDDCPTRDWVFLINSCFLRLDEITFSIEKGTCDLEFGSWWECVREAVREGLCERRGTGKGRWLVLRVGYGDWSVCEKFDG